MTLTPLKTEPESYPGVLLDLNDLIVIFPADSGVKPVYVMLSSPLDSGIFTRRQLQKNLIATNMILGWVKKRQQWNACRV
ncbi:S-type pyocin domain-containing protein [Pseudomonas aeruginosa]|uniref:S-type pyocin domain-containing protein n=1 Tax=Pseudomonas aeruginosa TaxID=287 RepID=UPI00397752EA